MTGWDDVVGKAAAVQRLRSMQIPVTALRSAAGLVESCDAGRAAGLGCGCGSVGDDVAAAVAVVDGAAASAGVAAGVGAGSSAMR